MVGLHSSAELVERDTGVVLNVAVRKLLGIEHPRECTVQWRNVGPSSAEVSFELSAMGPPMPYIS